MLQVFIYKNAGEDENFILIAQLEYIKIYDKMKYLYSKR